MCEQENSPGGLANMYTDLCIRLLDFMNNEMDAFQTVNCVHILLQSQCLGVIGWRIVNLWTDLSKN